ncbi:MAG: hypothetical protein M0027_12710 [Candidatus Dormibacteraeota bacterium]|jgi:hypothetical protein|nr:hypothetical protein [Candidatus Dormibacteraeota bacterium]
MIQHFLSFVADAAVIAAVLAFAIVLTPTLVEIGAVVLGWPEPEAWARETAAKDGGKR